MSIKAIASVDFLFFLYICGESILPLPDGIAGEPEG